jgi:hypothetical protein
MAGDDRWPFERTWELIDNVQLPEKPTLAEEIAEAFARIQDDSPAEPDTPQQGRKLSERTERELMRRLRRRKKNPNVPENRQRAIADDLGISPTTVQRYWVRMRG